MIPAIKEQVKTNIRELQVKLDALQSELNLTEYWLPTIKDKVSFHTQQSSRLNSSVLLSKLQVLQICQLRFLKICNVTPSYEIQYILPLHLGHDIGICISTLYVGMI